MSSLGLIDDKSPKMAAFRFGLSGHLILSQHHFTCAEYTPVDPLLGQIMYGCWGHTSCHVWMAISVYNRSYLSRYTLDIFTNSLFDIVQDYRYII